MRADISSPLSMLLLLLCGCYSKVSATREEIPPRMVEVVTVRAKPVAEELTLIGETEPWREAVLYFEVVGIVAEVFVEEGDIVSAGQPLAQLVIDDYELNVSKASAELAAVKALLARLHAGTRKEDLQAARAHHARTVTRVNYWTKQLERIRQLYASKAAEASELDETQRDYDEAVAAEHVAQAELDRAVAGPRIEELQEAQATVVALEQAVALARRQLYNATLRAPFPGRVERRLVDPGAYVNVFHAGGVPILHLIDLDQVDALIAVPEIQRERFRPGQSLAVTSVANPACRQSAVVVSIASVADRASGTYRMRARADNSAGQFTGNMVVRAEFQAAAKTRVIPVPLTAVLSSFGRRPYVLLVSPEQQTAVSREVELGAIHDSNVIIRRGLRGGELLIVRGQNLVVPGDKIAHRQYAGPIVANSKLPAP